MIYSISYADNFFSEAQKFNKKMALLYGKVDKTLEYSPESIDEKFRSENQKTLSFKQGGGLWLWKPYIIIKSLRNTSTGDYIIYSDSGSHFIKNSRYLTDALDASKKDLLSFELELPEYAYTKRTTIYGMNLQDKGFEKSNQRLASYIVLKNNSWTLDFFNEFLTAAKRFELLSPPTDRDFKDSPKLIDHRHDQSIFSLLSKKHEIPAHRDPSQWGNSRRSDYPNSPYPQVIEHTRQRQPKHAKLKYSIIRTTSEGWRKITRKNDDWPNYKK